MIGIVIGKKKEVRNNLIDADSKIKCPLRIKNGPLRIENGPLRIKNGPLRKNHEMRHFAY